MFCEMLPAFAFVPSLNVPHALEDLCSTDEFPSDRDPIVTYFEVTYFVGGEEDGVGFGLNIP